MRLPVRELQFAVRILRSSPAFTAVAVLTLGLGIACTTTVFSWVDGVLLHPYHGAARPGELAAFEMIKPSSPNGGTSISWLDYRDYRDAMKTLTGLAVHRQSAFSIGDGQPPRLGWGELVSANYFDVMGAKPMLGRFFTRDEETRIGSDPVAVISAKLWKSQFRSDPAVVGKTLRLNRRVMTIIGVAPADFHGSASVMQHDVWAPVTMGTALGLIGASTFTDRDDRGELKAICRRRPDAPIEQARAEAAAFAKRLEAAYPKTNQGIGATVMEPWREHNGVNEYLGRTLAILLAVSIVLLLIVCANVANLLLARSVGRQREFAIRCAIGAGRTRVAVQVMTETLVLASAGAAVGLLMLMWMQGSLIALVPSVGLPLNASLTINARILAYTAAACVATALISGASPALFVFHTNLNAVLQESGRSETGGAASRRTRSLLVAAEVALATVALVGAGLFVRSFQNTRAIDTGFDASNVLMGRFFIESAAFQGQQTQQFAERLRERLAESPAAQSVAYSDVVPLSSTSGPYNSVRVDGYTPAVGESTGTNRAMVSPGYFATMRIPLLAGRDFSAADDGKAEPAMIVNQAFQARYFHGQTAVGRRVRAMGKWWTVVGVARDSKYYSPAEARRPFFYLPFRQAYESSSEIYFLVKTNGLPEDAIPMFRRAVAETDRNVAAAHTVPLAEYTQVATFGQKTAATLMGALGIVCLVLAASGIYSVMSYTVNQRMPELGIRMALGATPGQVMKLVVGQGMKVAAAGLALGMAGALAAARLVGSLLVGVGAADPASFGIAAAFLGAAALAATWAPAFRATRSDPMGSLRR